MKLHLRNLFFILSISTAFWSCDEDDNLVPVNKLEAIAGDDRQVTTDTEVILNGAESKDSNNKPFIYQWTLKQKPTNSTTALSGQTTATPRFTPDIPGAYVIELRI